MKISNNEIAVVSDLHIGLHQDSPVWHEIILQFADWFRAELIKRNIKNVVICGDINNDRNEISVNSLHVLTKVFTLWKDFNITVIVGNHDSYYKDKPDVNSLSILSGWSNISIIDSIQTTEVFGKKLTFCPWGVTLNDIPNSDILFGHFEINGFNMTKNKVCDNGVTYGSILEKSPLIFSGHFHIREERQFDNNKKVVYVGSPYEQNWGDYGSNGRGFYLLNIEKDEYSFIENVVSPKHKRLRLSELYASGQMTEDLKREFRGNFVNLIVDQDFKTEKIEKLVAILNSYGPKSIKVDYLLENRYSNTENIEFEDIDIPKIIEEFVKTLDNDKCKDEILKTTLELYNECIA